MRAILTAGVVLVLAVGVGRGDPPSAPATPPAPPSRTAPLPPIPPISGDGVTWKKTERIDTPTEKPEKGDPKKLKDEMDKLLQEGKEGAKEKEKDKSEPADERTRLRNKLDELLEKLEQQKKTPKPTVPSKQPNEPSEPSKPLLPEGGKPIELVRAAGNLYRSGDAAAAEELLKLVDTTQLPKEDKAFADYLRAACHRKAGRTGEALKLYRAVAEAKDDPFLSENALVQIAAIKSAQELEAQLEQLKSRKKPK